MRKILILLVILVSPLFHPELLAQYKRSKISNDPFMRTQWWLGFRAGTNFTKAVPIESYSSFSPVNYEASEIEKVYDGYSTPGLQAGLEFTFYTRGFSVSIQPMFTRQFFSYSTRYQWDDPANPENSLEQNFVVENDLEYLDIPLIIKYDLMQTKARPFIQAGAYYSVLLSAGKTINSSGVDTASGAESTFESEEIKVGAGDLFTTSSAGLIAGVGVSVSQGNIRMVFDVNYRYGLNNITNTSNRYKDDRLASIGDVMDDINLRSIWIGIGAQFPLKFISKDYEAVN
jgi:hypothetical protein